jgi:hypothetical protein
MLQKKNKIYRSAVIRSSKVLRKQTRKKDNIKRKVKKTRKKPKIKKHVGGAPEADAPEADAPEGRESDRHSRSERPPKKPKTETHPSGSGSMTDRPARSRATDGDAARSVVKHSPPESSSSAALTRANTQNPPGASHVLDLGTKMTGRLSSDNIIRFLLKRAGLHSLKRHVRDYLRSMVASRGQFDTFPAQHPIVTKNYVPFSFFNEELRSKPWSGSGYCCVSIMWNITNTMICTSFDTLRSRAHKIWHSYMQNVGDSTNEANGLDGRTASRRALGEQPNMKMQIALGWLRNIFMKNSVAYHMINYELGGGPTCPQTLFANNNIKGWEAILQMIKEKIFAGEKKVMFPPLNSESVDAIRKAGAEAGAEAIRANDVDEHSDDYCNAYIAAAVAERDNQDGKLILPVRYQERADYLGMIVSCKRPHDSWNTFCANIGYWPTQLDRFISGLRRGAQQPARAAAAAAAARATDTLLNEVGYLSPLVRHSVTFAIIRMSNDDLEASLGAAASTASAPVTIPISPFELDILWPGFIDYINNHGSVKNGLSRLGFKAPYYTSNRGDMYVWEYGPWHEDAAAAMRRVTDLNDDARDSEETSQQIGDDS